MLKQYLNGLMDIVYPKRCLLCKADLKRGSVDDAVCYGCWDKIRVNLPPFCACCGRTLEANNRHKNICFKCQRMNLHFDRAFSPCSYEGELKELIHKFKYNNKSHLSKTLSKILIKFIKEYNLPLEMFDLIVPVPLHKTKLREREFNQAELLAGYLALEFKLNISRDNLIRVKETKSQALLKEADRLQNVRDVFQVRDSTEFKDKFILLIDDVLTTGATCSEAARALKKSGAKVVFALTLAN